MNLDFPRARVLLTAGDLRTLFIHELGWDNHTAQLDIAIAGARVTLSAVAQKRGMVAWQCSIAAGHRLPDYAQRRKIEHQAAKAAREHLIVFTDSASGAQIWQWVKRESNKPAACREHIYHRQQSGDALLQKLEAIAFSLEEEASLSLTDVTRRARAGFDVERVTRRFYDQFKKEHAAFLKLITGITEQPDQEWYASLMLNRLMFVYFIQRKGFLDSDQEYLRNRLKRMRIDHGTDKFYSFYRYFLLRLFHEGLGASKRTPELEKLVGRIPYLNGGLFDVHELEHSDRYGKTIEIPDRAFEHIFNFFDLYQWNLDERPLRDDKQINPDVLGYIFEKYINQKQMGAYYTKEDITEYISKNAVIPFLLDAARGKCKVAFDNPGGPTVWDVLKDDPDRYIYPPARHGVTWDIYSNRPLEELHEVPSDIAAGLNPPSLHRPVNEGPVQTMELRKGWNKPAPQEYALPTETWREVIARRKRYAEVKAKLAADEVRDINDLITFNLDIRQFAQDVIQNCEGPELLRAFWHTIEKVTILDPTCGSGAFLFAALNILEPLYESCLDLMEAFVGDLDRSGEKHRPEKYSDFRQVLANVAAHPNRRYFIFKNIILNNLYGVDIMEEAVEICKLRLFLKLVAQVDPDIAKPNLGIEPLPDIDFNIRAGNTLVGFSTYEEVRQAVHTRLDFENALEKIQVKAADLQQAFDAFRARQVAGDGSVPTEDKQELRKRLTALEEELDRYLATEYGVAPSKKDSYAEWLRSHQPFHWFVEFYGIMRAGGFDVIIGNPPYLEYTKVSDYKVGDYKTKDCSNLYVFTVERAFRLSGPTGRVGMIIPISSTCSGAMQPLRNYLALTAHSFWLSHFSNRPGQLFTGAQNRLTIFVSSGRSGATRQFSTRYHRWDARNGERENLFPTLRFQPLSSDGSMLHGLLPKVGSPEAAAILAKIASTRTVGSFMSKQAHHNLFWARVPGYFCQFFLEPPMARPEGGGPARVRGEVNSIAFDDKLKRHVVHAVLNSSTYYHFFSVYTDTRHINPSDVTDFPLDLNAFNAGTKIKLNELSKSLEKCFTAHTTQWRKSGLLIDSTDAKACKPILDEIDCVLSRHFGFTEQELDFIINYDIKYRMGRDEEDEHE